MVGNIGLKHLEVIKEDTLNKWNSLGFLDGLKGHGERKHRSVIRKPSYTFN
jgi:hypothetical protein